MRPLNGSMAKAKWRESFMMSTLDDSLQRFIDTSLYKDH
jgi:hypothetical protein